jgi:hypothetical protein
MLHDFQMSDVVLIFLLLIVVACFVAIQFAPRTNKEQLDEFLSDGS